MTKNITIYNQFKKSLVKALDKVGIKENNPQIELNKNGINGNFSTTVALSSAKQLRMKPVDIANKIKNELLKEDSNIKNIEVAGPGFINVEFKPEFISNVINNVMSDLENYGRGEPKNYDINLEEVSANPTGYLHVGHARNAIISDALVRIFRFDGYNVQTEYWINDAGNQINVLAVTVFVYYLNALGKKTELPENSYRGEGYEIVAQKIIDKFGDKFKNEPIENEKIANPDVLEIFKEYSIKYFLEIIQNQLIELGNEPIQYWNSEQKIYDEGLIPKVLKEFDKLGATYNQEGALFLRTTEFDDDKDRVLVKSDGTYTYLTPDIASHDKRIKRTKADKLINVWGGDHHGYVPRLKAALSLLGNNPDLIEIEMIQMVRLVKDGQEFKMSKRAGTAVWLVDLLEMVGKDALRYMLASKSGSSHMDLDLDLIKQKDASNPVYYAQYATARLNSILRQAKEKGIHANLEPSNNLSNEKEIELLITLDDFARTVDNAAKNRAPHIITDYIQTIAKQFHSYYAETKIIDDEDLISTSYRLGLVEAVLQVLKNAFNLIGVKQVEQM